MNSNTRTQRVPTRFARETRFRLTPRVRPADQSHATEFRQLKARLLTPALSAVVDPGLRRQLLLAANEAAAVAWTTDYPMLVFPELLQEKTNELREYTERQAEIREASPVLEVVEA